MGTESFEVRGLTPEDVNDTYVSWLNDSQNRRYLSIRRSQVVTSQSQRDYVGGIRDGEASLLMGFYADGRLIGTTGMQLVGLPKKHPALGILIGDGAYRGRGLGAVWVWVGTRILYDEYGAEKVFAGTLSPNDKSLRSFLRAGYVIEGTLRRQEWRERSGWCDYIYIGCFRDELVSKEEVSIKTFDSSEDRANTHR